MNSILETCLGLASIIMGTHRKNLGVASLLFGLGLLIIIDVGKVGANNTPANEADAFSARCALFAHLDSSGFLRATGPRRSPALEPHLAPSLQTSPSCSDLFEEETDSHFNILNNTASHILFALSDQSRRSSVWMKPAACPARLYLIYSALLC